MNIQLYVFSSILKGKKEKETTQTINTYASRDVIPQTVIGPVMNDEFFSEEVMHIRNIAF